jgi:hypothetical protein
LQPNYLAKHPESFVSVRKLQLRGFSSVTLSGLIGLKELTLMNVPLGHVVGKEEVYPQLKSYAFHAGVDPNDELDCYYALLKNVTDFAVYVIDRSHFVLPEGSKITFLELMCKDISLDFAQENRFFESVRLYSCGIQSYSVFSNVQKLVQKNPMDATDISPL